MCGVYMNFVTGSSSRSAFLETSSRDDSCEGSISSVSFASPVVAFFCGAIVEGSPYGRLGRKEGR